MAKRIEKLILFDPDIPNAKIATILTISPQLVSYHTKRIARSRGLVRTGRASSACWSCGHRIGLASRTGACRECRRLSYGSEIHCAPCGEVSVVYGLQAASRRRNKSVRLKARGLWQRDREFCDKACTASFRRSHGWGQRKPTEQQEVRTAVKQPQELGPEWLPLDADNLASVLHILEKRHARVIQLRFGLEDGRGHTLKDVGRDLGVTRERIRQIEAKSLRKLRAEVTRQQSEQKG